MAVENATPNSPTVYSVPRRYDLATLIVVTVVFSVLFAGLKLLKAKPDAFLLIVGFVVVVGLSQAILPKAPRVASVAAGSGFFVIALIVGVVMEGMSVRLLNDEIPVFAFLGAIYGYLGGTLIGGVFLAADYGRKWAKHRRAS
jgi:hypothetical protein